MLVFLVFCILLVIAFPLFVWIAIAGFWVIVGLLGLIAAIWAVFWAIEGLEYVSSNVTPPAIVADIDWDIVWTLASGAGAVIGVVVIVVCVIFTPKIGSK